MQLKTASKLAIACLSLSALIHLSREIWTHRLIVSGAFNDMRTLYMVTSAIEVLLLHVPLIIFFVVLYQKQNIDGLR